jgi:branched-chain amino acid aminotransferase
MVSEIDGKPIGEGAYPVTDRIRKLYKQAIAEDIAR